MECLFILYGPTSRNGKGTTMESILRIMGEYGKNADPTMLQAKFNAQSGGPSEEIARIAGSRFVNISEPEKKITLDSRMRIRQFFADSCMSFRKLPAHISLRSGNLRPQHHFLIQQPLRDVHKEV